MQQLPDNILETETRRLQPAVTLTDGADYAGVSRCDWLLVDVQQTEMLQEGVSHAGIQLLLLNERVWHFHHIRVAPDASYSDKRMMSVGPSLS